MISILEMTALANLEARYREEGLGCLEGYEAVSGAAECCKRIIINR